MNVKEFEAIHREITEFQPEKIEIYRISAMTRIGPFHEMNIERNELKQKLLTLSKGLETREIFEVTHFDKEGKVVKKDFAVEATIEQRRSLLLPKGEATA